VVPAVSRSITWALTTWSRASCLARLIRLLPICLRHRQLLAGSPHSSSRPVLSDPGRRKALAWGAAFLKAIGQNEKARRALSYARDVLQVPAQGVQFFGFDGQAGPWSVWNEGIAQYIAVGGEGARDLLPELLGQQRKDGAMPGSPDEFNGGGVWTTRWHGVAPTAWLYHTLCGEPFHPVTRAQMAVFLLRAKHGLSYSPPDAGASTGFGDVPTAHWAAAWIRRLAAEGITGGCGGGNYYPDQPVTRAQMAVFLVKTFNLP
jgi:hypothetical protein